MALEPDSSKNPVSYEAVPVEGDGVLADVRLEVGGRTWHLAGRGGREAEERAAEKVLGSGRGLPVLVGSGLGAGLAKVLAESGRPVAVVDREEKIHGLTGVRERYGADPRILWVEEAEADAALQRLTSWQMRHGGEPFRVLANPVYQRLDPDYYGVIRQRLEASGRIDFWARTRYGKFKSETPRILLITSQYFIMGELLAALKRMGIPHHFLEFERSATGSAEFVQKLLTGVVEFKPDFVLTVNHLGVDREGVLADLLERLELPMASWFVDNPILVLSAYEKLVNPWTALFTWDADNIEPLKAMGFAHVSHLPLAADTLRFAPGRGKAKPEWRSDVSFVGNSMVIKTARRLTAADPPPELTAAYPALAREFGQSSERSVAAFMEKRRPELFAAYAAMEPVERQLAFQTLVTWESTRLYRKQCLEKILPFTPLIAGDPGWLETFPDEGTRWRYHAELSYYDDLPAFYPASAVNFNCTSLQMKGAVNQRVFDVPACGAFLITDRREQMEELFEPGREVVVYGHTGEIPALVRHYLDHPAERDAVVRAARKRILAEHTYDRRVERLVAAMRKAFGSST